MSRPDNAAAPRVRSTAKLADSAVAQNMGGVSPSLKNNALR